MEWAQITNPDVGREAVKRIRAEAVNEALGRHLTALDHAAEQNASTLRDTLQAHEAMEHLRALRAEAKAAKRQIDIAAENRQAAGASAAGPSI